MAERPPSHLHCICGHDLPFAFYDCQSVNFYIPITCDHCGTIIWLWKARVVNVEAYANARNHNE